AYEPTIISWIGLFRKRLDRHPRLRPLAGIVDKVADHFLQVLLLAAEAGALSRVDVAGPAAVGVNLFRCAGEWRYHCAPLVDGTERRGAGGEPRALEMARDLVAHDLGLLAHLQGERIAALTRGLVHHDRDRRLQCVCEVADMGTRARHDLTIGVDERISFAR